MKTSASLFLLLACALGGLSCHGQEGTSHRSNGAHSPGGVSAWESGFIIDVRRPWGRLPWEEEEAVPGQDQATGSRTWGWGAPGEPGGQAPNTQGAGPDTRQPWSFGSIPDRDRDYGLGFQDDGDVYIPRARGAWPAEPLYPGTGYPETWSPRGRYYDRPPPDPWSYQYRDSYGYRGWEPWRAEPPRYGGPGGWEPGYDRDRYYYEGPAMGLGFYRYPDYYGYPGRGPWYGDSGLYGGFWGRDPWSYPYYDGYFGDPWAYGFSDFYGPWLAEPWLYDGSDALAPWLW
jgi:hypothetical protein